MKTILHIELEAWDKIHVPRQRKASRVFTGEDFEIHMQHGHARYLYHKLGELFADGSGRNGQPMASNIAGDTGGAVALNISGAKGAFQSARSILRNSGGSFDRELKRWSIDSGAWSRVKDSVYGTGISVELFLAWPRHLHEPGSLGARCFRPSLSVPDDRACPHLKLSTPTNF